MPLERCNTDTRSFTLMNALQPLLQQQLRSLFDAEVQLNLMLPRMIEKSTDTHLREGLEQIFGDTHKNIQQIQDVCNLLGTPPTGVVCRTMQDLIREAGEATRNTQTTDASLIATTQSIVHYEIASFDMARLIARSLGRQDASRMLENLTTRVGMHDQMLTQIALASIN